MFNLLKPKKMLNLLKPKKTSLLPLPLPSLPFAKTCPSDNKACKKVYAICLTEAKKGTKAVYDICMAEAKKGTKATSESIISKIKESRDLEMTSLKLMILAMDKAFMDIRDSTGRIGRTTRRETPDECFKRVYIVLAAINKAKAYFSAMDSNREPEFHI
jgi:hypothetical protein